MTARELVECPVIVGTAGHVDHGKSALIEALTGKNPDRLEVERRRGMTTELGFGELELPSGKLVGLVDVPGHAHYLRAMVQGATGVDVALLAVSAVEGVMPQTREHVRVLELLGVTRMVVALTMRDLADHEIAALAELDVEAFLDGTVFAGASIVPVSSKTGEGLDELLTTLDNTVCSCWSEHLEATAGSGAAPRLPIDRCFSIRGTGTVVTGTLHDGPVSVGDELVALPSQSRCRRARVLSAGERALYAALESGDVADGVHAWLALQTLPVAAAGVAAALDLVTGEVEIVLRGLVDQAAVCELAAGGAVLYADASALDAAMDVLAAALSSMHAAAPKEIGFTSGAVAHAAWPGAGNDVAMALIAEGSARGVCAVDGAEVFDPHSAAAAIRVVREAGQRIVALLDEAGLNAPTLPEVSEQLQLDRDTMTRALRELSLNHSIVKVERDVALSAAAEAHAREVVATAIEAAGGAATTSVLREALGVSRKRTISILEHLDAVRFTVLDKESGGLRSLR